MPARNPFSAEPAARTREEAEAVIEAALTLFREKAPNPAQLLDLADAMDALREKRHSVAIALTLAALSPSIRASAKAIRPVGMARTLEELSGDFDALRSRASELPPSRQEPTAQ